MKQLVFSKDELLAELGIVENTLRAMIEHNGFPHPRKMRAKLFWLLPEVIDWLSHCPRSWSGVGAQDSVAEATGEEGGAGHA